MRIALVSDTYLPQVNGVTTVVHRIVQLVREAGHAAAIVAPRYPHGSGGDGGGGSGDELRVPSLPFPPYPSSSCGADCATPWCGAGASTRGTFAPSVARPDGVAGSGAQTTR